MEYEDFLKALRQERKRKGFSLKKLGQALGISIVKMSAIERGQTALKVKDYFAICDILKISPVELMGGKALTPEQNYVADKMKNLSDRDIRVVKDLILLMGLQEEDL